MMHNNLLWNFNAMVTQQPTILVNPSSIELNYDNRNASIALYSNGSWVVDSKPDWLNVTPSSGSGNATVYITFTGNPHFLYEGTVVFRNSTVTASVYVIYDPLL